MLTLKELKKIVKVADMEKRIPSVKSLKEHKVVVKEMINADTTISVYDHGYVLYTAGNQSTVFPLHSCDDYEYVSVVTMFYFESALIYEILLASMWGFLLKSVIGAYVSNFAFWIIAMIASIANHKLSFLARYDASNPIFLRFNQYYNTGNTEYLDIIGNVIYTIILSGVILGIVCAFRKRWEKNGI